MKTRAIMVAMLAAIAWNLAACAGTWPTFRGDSSLRGVSKDTLPGKPERLWQYRADSGIATAVVSDGKRLYCGTDDGTVVALMPDGRQAWAQRVAFDTNAGAESPAIFGPMAVFGAQLYLGTDQGYLVVLDAAAGKEKWRYDVKGNVQGTPGFMQLADQAPRVAVLSQPDGIVHCVDAATGKRVWVSAETARCDGSLSTAGGFVVLAGCDSTLHTFSAATGEAMGRTFFGDNAQVAGSPALSGGQAFAGNRSGAVSAVDLATGRIVWTNTDSESEMFTVPAVTDTHVYFGSSDGYVRALDRKDGRAAWVFETDDEPRSPVVAGDRIVVTDGAVVILLDAASGRKTWSAETGGMLFEPAVVDGRIIVAGDDGAVTAFGERPAKP